MQRKEEKHDNINDFGSVPFDRAYNARRICVTIFGRRISRIYYSPHHLGHCEAYQVGNLPLKQKGWTRMASSLMIIFAENTSPIMQLMN